MCRHKNGTPWGAVVVKEQKRLLKKGVDSWRVIWSPSRTSWWAEKTDLPNYARIASFPSTFSPIFSKVFLRILSQNRPWPWPWPSHTGLTGNLRKARTSPSLFTDKLDFGMPAKLTVFRPGFEPRSSENHCTHSISKVDRGGSNLWMIWDETNERHWKSI